MASIQMSATPSQADNTLLEQRRLYPLANIAPTVPPSHVRARPLQSPGSRMGELADRIVAAMPWPSFSPFSEATGVEERVDLFSLLQTSTAFFHSAAAALWKCPVNIQALVRVLYLATGELDTSDMAHMSSRETELCIYSHVSRMLVADNGVENPAFNRFRFYAGCIAQLQASSDDTPTTLISYLASLLPIGVYLFPNLQELSWVENQPCVSSGTITSLLFACNISRLTLCLLDQPLATATDEGCRFYTESVVDLLVVISSAAPELRELTVQALSAVTIPAEAIMRFEYLRDANLHVSVSAAHFPIASTLGEPQIDHLESLELHWTPDTDLAVVASLVDSPTLEALTVMAYNHLGTGFLYDMYLLSHHTPMWLTTVEIFSVDAVRYPTDSGVFVNFIQPLLSRRGIQNLAVVLGGYRFHFSIFDLDRMARAWPGLRALNIGFELADSSRLPDLQCALTHMIRLCPLLEFLHIPGFITSATNGPFELGRFSGTSVLQHLSSDIVDWEHHVLDIALALYEAFPLLEQLGPCDEPSSWTDLQELVTSLRKQDYLNILEYVLSSTRAGTYSKFPRSLREVARLGAQLGPVPATG